MRSGDYVNVIVLVAAIVYQCLILGHAHGSWHLDAFGQNWGRDGFCLSFKDTQYFHTHLLCLYGDLIFALLLYQLSRHTTRPELRPVKDSCWSIVGHGVAHGFLWSRGETVIGTIMAEPLPAMQRVAFSAGGMLFFAGFLTSVSTTGPRWLTLGQSAVHGAFLVNYVPEILAFSYVNTVIFANITGSQLLYGLEGKKDEFYDLFAFLGSLPIMAVAVMEPLLCDSILVHYGGHIAFDYTIPIVTALYFLMSQSMTPRRNENEKKTQ